MIAAIKGNAEIVTVLIELGANPEAIDKDKKTALMWANDKGFGASVSQAIEAGKQALIVRN